MKLKNKKPTLLILAAGMGSRYGGLKQLDVVGLSGETIMDYSVYDAIRAGFGKVVFVIRKELEKAFKTEIFPKYQNLIEVDYVFQELDDLPIAFSLQKNRLKPWGTAHAVLAARSKIKENFAVINADDFYGTSAFQLMADFLKDKANPKNFCLVTYELGKTTSLHGSVSRGICSLDAQNNLISVIEHTKIEVKNEKIVSSFEDTTIELSHTGQTSMNFMGFTPDIFANIAYYFKIFLEKNSNNPTAEFFLPNILMHLIKENKATIKCLQTNEKWFGITYKEDKKIVTKALSQKIDSGDYPEKLFHTYE